MPSVSDAPRPTPVCLCHVVCFFLVASARSSWSFRTPGAVVPQISAMPSLVLTLAFSLSTCFCVCVFFFHLLVCLVIFFFVLKAGCDVPGENCGAAGPSADGFTLRLLGVGLFLPILPFAAAAASGAAIPFGFLALVSPLGLPHTASEPCSSCSPNACFPTGAQRTWRGGVGAGRASCGLGTLSQSFGKAELGGSPIRIA